MIAFGLVLMAALLLVGGFVALTHLRLWVYRRFGR